MRFRKHGRAVVAIAVTSMLLGAAPGVTSDDVDLETYRSWTLLTPSATSVPFELAIQCAAVTDAQLEQARKTYGPHTNRWIKVYANPLAASALRDQRSTVFPVGAAIAKEKLRAPDDMRPEGVAFMIKRGKGQFVESDGWEFVYRPTGDKPSYSGCVACHRAGARKDYVFGRYGR